jgi:FdhD protein
VTRGRTQSAIPLRYSQGSTARTPDELIVEEPLTIRLDDIVVATTMRTPGDDFELAAGFCHADGLLGGADIRHIRYCGTGSATESDFNVVSVETGGLAPTPTPRLGLTSSSCGLCGSEAIETLTEQYEPVDPGGVDPEILIRVSDGVRPSQDLFGTTGAAHAAAAFAADGTPLLVREDIGRHNAVDKVVGRFLLDGRLPANGLGLFVSGRASFEMVQKAWSAGFASVLSVSAPSALAVDTARAAGIQLAGFVRDRALNVYT